MNTSGCARPRDPAFRLATPAAWFDVDLDPGTRHASIARLVEERVAAERVAYRPRLAAVMKEAAAHAVGHGAVFASMFSDVVDGRPVSAALVVSVIRGSGPVDEGVEIAEINSRLAAHLGGEAVTLPAGPAVRRCRRQQADAGGGEVVVVVGVEYYVPVPGADVLLLLSFSTPTADLALVDLFDSMASSLGFVAP